MMPQIADLLTFTPILQAAGKSKKNIEKTENEKTSAEEGVKLVAGKSLI